MNPTTPLNNTADKLPTTKGPRLGLYALISFVVGIMFLFQFSPFMSRVSLDQGAARIQVLRGQEVVFYGEVESCDVRGVQSGIYERPSSFEVPRLLDGVWYKPWATVYNRYGAGKSNSIAPSAYADITCTDKNAKVWFTGIESFDFLTQNTPVGIRFLWAGGAFFLTAVFLWTVLAQRRHS